MPPRKSVGKSPMAVPSTGAAEAPATETAVRRVTRRSETPGGLVRLPNKSPKRKSTGRTNPTPQTKPALLKENIPPSESTPPKTTTRRSAAADPPETPGRSGDEAEPSPRQSARARKQTARATESWALKKAKKKADKEKNNQEPSVIKDSIPSPKKIAVKRRTLLCHDKAEVDINTEADSRKLAYEEELKCIINNRKRGPMWPAEEDSYDDGRLPDTEDDETARSILATPNTTPSLAAKKTLKRVTKRQSLTKENDNIDMDEDDSDAILYETKSAKNDTPKVKRRKLTIDVEEDEEILVSNLSPIKTRRSHAAHGTFAVGVRPQKKCYCCQTPESRHGGWKGEPIKVGAKKDFCSACSEQSALAMARELRGSLISQAKEKIRASQGERDSIEETSGRSRKATDKESASEALKREKTAREKSLEKARAAKAQKTYKTKSMKNLRNQHGNSATRQRSLSSVISGIESEHDLDAPITKSGNNGHDSDSTPSLTADAPRRSRRAVGASSELTTEIGTREESGDKMTRATSVLDPSTFYGDDGELMYHVCPYYIEDEHQGLIWGIPQGAKNKKYKRSKPWQWCVKEPSVREGRMGGDNRVCLWEDLEPIREDWWDEKKGRMRWLSGFETVRIDKRKLATPMRRLTTPTADDGSRSEMRHPYANVQAKREPTHQPLMSKEQREIENEKVKSRRGKAPVAESDTWIAMIMDLRRNTQSGEIFMMIALWWTRDEVKFQLGQFGRTYLNKRWPISKPWEFMLGAHFEVVPWEAFIERVEARNDPRFCHEMMYGAETLNYEVFGREVGRGSYNLDGLDLNTEDRALWKAWKRQGSRKGLTEEERRSLETERDKHEERERATFAKLVWTRELWDLWLERRRRIDLGPEESEAEDRAREEAERKAKRKADNFLMTPKMEDKEDRHGDGDGEDEAFQHFQVKAIWEHISKHREDLSFSSGQIISVVKVEDENWYMGAYTDAKGVERKGIFPRNRVERYDLELNMELDY